MPSRCAIAETLAPGSNASATARALNSSDQRRRSCRGAPSRRSATASIIWKVLVPELGADIEAHSSSSCPLPISDRSPPPPDGVCLPLTLMPGFIHDFKHGISAISNHSVPLLSMKEPISRSQSQKERWDVRRAHHRSDRSSYRPCGVPDLPRAEAQQPATLSHPNPSRIR